MRQQAHCKDTLDDSHGAASTAAVGPLPVSLLAHHRHPSSDGPALVTEPPSSTRQEPPGIKQSPTPGSVTTLVRTGIIISSCPSLHSLPLLVHLPTSSIWEALIQRSKPAQQRLKPDLKPYQGFLFPAFAARTSRPRTRGVSPTHHTTRQRCSSLTTQPRDPSYTGQNRPCRRHHRLRW